MGKSAKFAKRPGRKSASSDANNVGGDASSTKSGSIKPLKKSAPTLSKTSNNPISKPTLSSSSTKSSSKASVTVPATEKLGKNEISIDRPDYIDLFSGRKTFHRQVREKVLLKGVPQGTRVVSASAVAAAVQNAKEVAGKAAASSSSKRGADSMDWS